MLQMPVTFDWLFWGVGLMLAMPVLVVGLGELSEVWARKGKLSAKRALDLVRNSCLLVAFVMILLRYVVGLPSTHLANRVVDTIFYIAVLNAALVISDLLLFEAARAGGESKLPKLATELGRIFLVLLGGAFVVSHVWQIDLQGLLAALGVGSLVIGLALQDTMSGLFAGITVVSTRTLKPGDRIQMGDLEGEVRTINWRNVSVATLKGDLVLIPNGQIARDRVHIVGGDNGSRRITVDVRIAYSDPPENVREMLLDVVSGVPLALKTPAPHVVVKSLEDNCVAYSVVFYVASDVETSLATDAVLSSVWYVAERRGVGLIGRVMERTWPVEAMRPRVVGEAELVERIKALGTFEDNPDVLAQLVRGARVELYRRGEVLFQEGERGHSYFVVSEGVAQSSEKMDGAEVSVDTFTRGDMVLMKAFLRGGGSPFTVRAVTDVQVITLLVAELEPVLAENVELAHTIERTISLRHERAMRNLAKSSSAAATHADQSSESAERARIMRELFKV